MFAAFRERRELALGNLALRQLLGVLKREEVPRLKRKDRVFWVVLSRIWSHWRGIGLVEATLQRREGTTHFSLCSLLTTLTKAWRTTAMPEPKYLRFIDDEYIRGNRWIRLARAFLLMLHAMAITRAQLWSLTSYPSGVNVWSGEGIPDSPQVLLGNGPNWKRKTPPFMISKCEIQGLSKACPLRLTD